MTAMPMFTVVGGINHDEILQTTVDPRDDATAEIYGSVVAVGGHAANAAVTLARLGLPVRLIGAVGTDPVGRWVLEQLERERVDVSDVLRIADRPTGRAVVVNGPSLHYMMLSRGANESLDPRHAAAVVCRADGPLLMFDVAPAALEALLEATPAATAVVANPGGRTAQALPALSAAGARTVLVCNETESAAAAAAHPSQGIPERWTGLVASVVTRGGAGCRLFQGRQIVDVAPQPVATVDPTGAGDAFTAGFAASWCLGASPREACVTGSQAGAAAVRNVGAWPSRESLADLASCLAAATGPSEPH